MEGYSPPIHFLYDAFLCKHAEIVLFDFLFCVSFFFSLLKTVKKMVFFFFPHLKHRFVFQFYPLRFLHNIMFALIESIAPNNMITEMIWKIVSVKQYMTQTFVELCRNFYNVLYIFPLWTFKSSLTFWQVGRKQTKICHVTFPKKKNTCALISLKEVIQLLHGNYNCRMAICLQMSSFMLYYGVRSHY